MPIFASGAGASLTKESIMTARHKKMLIGWVAGGAAAALLAGGCTRVSSAWSALTAKPENRAALDPQIDDVESDATPGPVAQGEEGTAFAEDDTLAQTDTTPAAPASANAPATVAEVHTPAVVEPIKVPVINVFGELDGQQVTARTSSGDAGIQQHTFSDEGYDGDVNVDPSGHWLVYTSTRHSETPQLYLQRVDGTSVTQLTSDPSENAQPAFSPDGKSIAFCSTRAGSWDLYTMDVDGRNVTQITSGPAQDMHPSFSPDGSRLAYCSIGGRSGQWEVWVVTLATREKKMIAHGLFPTWAPDRSVDRIAFQRARQRGSRWFSLWTLELADGEARKITEVAVSSNAAIISPCWNADGKRLAFATVVDPAQTSKGKPRGQHDIWTIDADGGSRHRLTDGTSTCLSPCWSMDGRVFFISDRGGHENVWSVRTDAPTAWPVAAKNLRDLPGGTATVKELPSAAPQGAQPKTAVGSTNSEVER